MNILVVSIQRTDLLPFYKPSKRNSSLEGIFVFFYLLGASERFSYYSLHLSEKRIINF